MHLGTCEYIYSAVMTDDKDFIERYILTLSSYAFKATMLVSRWTDGYHPLIHEFVTSRSLPDILNYIKTMSGKDQLDILSAKDKDGNNIIHKCCGLLDNVMLIINALEQILRIFSPITFCQMVCEKNAHCDTVLHVYAKRCTSKLHQSMSLFEFFRNKLQHLWVSSVSQEDGRRNNVLHMCCGNPHAIYYLLTKLGSYYNHQAYEIENKSALSTHHFKKCSTFAKLALQKNSDGQSCLHLSALMKDPLCFTQILSQIPKNLQYSALADQDGDGNNVLHKLLKNSMLHTSKDWLNGVLHSTNQDGYLTLLGSRNKFSKTPITACLGLKGGNSISDLNPQSNVQEHKSSNHWSNNIITALDYVNSFDHRRLLIKQRDSFGCSLLHHAVIAESKHLTQYLTRNLYPEDIAELSQIVVPSNGLNAHPRTIFHLALHHNDRELFYFLYSCLVSPAMIYWFRGIMVTNNIAPLQTSLLEEAISSKIPIADIINLIKIFCFNFEVLTRLVHQVQSIRGHHETLQLLSVFEPRSAVKIIVARLHEAKTYQTVLEKAYIQASDAVSSDEIERFLTNFVQRCIYSIHDKAVLSDTFAQASQGCSLLHVAAALKMYGIVVLLLSSMTPEDIIGVFQMVDSNQNTLVDKAREYGALPELVPYLEVAVSENHARRHVQLQALGFLPQESLLLRKSHNGNTLIHTVLRLRATDLLEFMLSNIMPLDLLKIIEIFYGDDFGMLRDRPDSFSLIQHYAVAAIHGEYSNSAYWWTKSCDGLTKSKGNLLRRKIGRILLYMSISLDLPTLYAAILANSPGACSLPQLPLLESEFHGKTLLHTALQQQNISMFGRLLHDFVKSLLPGDVEGLFLSVSDSNDGTTIVQAASALSLQTETNSHNYLKHLIDFLLETGFHKEAILCSIHAGDESLLQKSLNLITFPISSYQSLTAMMVSPCISKPSILHYVIELKKFPIILQVIKKLSEPEKCQLMRTELATQAFLTADDKEWVCQSLWEGGLWNYLGDRKRATVLSHCNKDGNTILHWIMMNPAMSNSDLSDCIMDSLAECNMALNNIILKENSAKKTPIELGIAHRNHLMVDILMDKCSEETVDRVLKRQNSAGMNLLTYAAIHGEPSESWDILLDQYSKDSVSDLLTPDPDLNNPLIHAVCTASEPCTILVKVLKKAPSWTVMKGILEQKNKDGISCVDACRLIYNLHKEDKDGKVVICKPLLVVTKQASHVHWGDSLTIRPYKTGRDLWDNMKDLLLFLLSCYGSAPLDNGAVLHLTMSPALQYMVSP